MSSSALYQDALAGFKNDTQNSYTDAKDRELLKQFLSEQGTPEDSRAAAKRLDQESSRKYGARRVSGDTSIPEIWIHNILSNISSFISVGNYAMEGAPESVGLAWFGVTLVLKAIESDFKLYGLFGSGLTDITEIMVLIPHYDRMYDERSSPTWKSTPIVEKLFRDIVNAYTAVLHFSFSVKRHIEPGKLRRVNNGIKNLVGLLSADFDEKISYIASLKQSVLDDTQAAFAQGVLDSFKSLDYAVKDIRHFQATSVELHEKQIELLNEVRHTFKAKTPRDFAMQDVERIKERLSVPVNDTPSTLQRLRSARLPATCHWILENASYIEWERSKFNSVLCLVGAKGSGKSTILAAVYDQISDHYATECVTVLHASCDIDDFSSTTNRRSSKLAAIYSTLYLQILQVVSAEDKDVSLLENCNKVFSIPKGRSGIARAISQKDDYLPKFEEAILQLASLLKTDIYIVLDAVEFLDEKEQIELLAALKAIFEAPTSVSPQQVRTIVGCSVAKPFHNEFESMTNIGTSIDADDNHRPDMESKIKHELRDAPCFSEADVGTATGAIIKKAGHDFGYVAHVAIPYLKEPFTESVSDRLKGLPEGIQSVYKTSFAAMPSNYADLLRTALSWTVFSPGSALPTIEEISDAFHGTYDSATVEEYSGGSSTDAGFPVATDNLRKQLERSAGPFLRLDGNEVSLQDWERIPEFCKEVVDHDERDEGHVTGHYCDRCKKLLSQPRSLAFDEKREHLQRALMCLRHLNNPVFQRRAGLLEGFEAIEDPEAVLSKTEESTSDTPNDASDKVPAAEAMDDQHGDSDIGATAGGVADGDENLDDGAQAEFPNNEDPGELSDESVDDEDKEGAARDTEGDDTYIYSSPDRGSHVRYEILHWPFHLRRAEEPSTDGIRPHDNIWADILTELERLTSNTIVFHNWQRKVASAKGDEAGYLGKLRSPLHVASFLGLVTWAERLIEQGQDPNELCGGENALQAAAVRADCHPMLELLLKKGGDVNFESDKSMSAFNRWLFANSSLKALRLMLDHGGNPMQVADKKHGTWSPMHHLSCTGDDPEALELLLDHIPAEHRLEFINVMTPEGWPPILILLSRRNVPKQLLKAFLNHGADINVDGDHSLRALQMACYFGELECVSIILEHNVEDIDDPDDEGNTALHQACLGGHTKCLELIADKGADINRTNNRQSTPLHAAAWAGYTECVRMLLGRGANACCLDLRSRTPLFMACEGKSQEATMLILDSLLEAKRPISEINRSTKRGRSPLRQASSRGFDDVVQRMINIAREAGDVAGLDVDGRDMLKGANALHLASRHGHVKCVRLLLGVGADASLQTKDAKTALVLAYENWAKMLRGDLEDIISMLVEKEPEAAKIDTKLHGICATNGSTRLLRQLHHLGADLHRQDPYGWTPLELAQSANQTEVACFLRERGVLPSRWLARGDLVSEDGLTVTKTTHRGIVSLSPDRPLPPSIAKYYFEITFLDPSSPPAAATTAAVNDSSSDGRGDKSDPNNNSKSSSSSSNSNNNDKEKPPKQYPIVAIGFCTLGGAMIEFPGWEPLADAPAARSWAYHGDDGGFFSSTLGPGATWVKKGPRYGLVGDTVGCGVDFGQQQYGGGSSGGGSSSNGGGGSASATIWFTYNGERLGQHEFTDVRGRLFPVLGLRDAVRLETRFGGDFLYRGGGGVDGQGVTDGEGDA
ncbi:hypothetical protein PG985_000070 [Apiospora marii]|uniref:uncharacterized protein n=1 Tax=Apiospora marii TaxID=335849 RepID=UPI00312EC59E